MVNQNKMAVIQAKLETGLTGIVLTVFKVGQPVESLYARSRRISRPYCARTQRIKSRLGFQERRGEEK